MKSVFAQIIVLTLLSSLSVSCSNQSEADKTSGAARVRIPWYTEKDGYGLQWVTLDGLNSLSSANGKYARFYFAPRIVNKRLEGIEPKARFVKTDKGFAPADTTTQQMVTIYAHLQRLAALDSEMGAGHVNTWPRQVAVGVVMTGGMKNNAFYDGETDAMLFLPYSATETAIAVNAGILAHEHFHSLFHKLVLKPLKGTEAMNIATAGSVHEAKAFYKAMGIEAPAQEAESFEESKMSQLEIPTMETITVEAEPLDENDETSPYYHVTLLRGLNEGLADFWAWVYTGDPDFIAASLPHVKSLRTLNTSIFFFPQKDSFNDSVKSVTSIYAARRERATDWREKELLKMRMENRLLGLSYQTGTQVSRALKNYTDVRARNHKQTSQAARKEVAQMIIKALPEMSADLLQAVKQNKSYDPTLLMTRILSHATDISTEEQTFIDGLNLTKAP